MRYRRANVAGATYFFTVNLAERQSNVLVEHIDALRETVQRVKDAHPFHIDAMIVLPDHLHALRTLPAGDADFARRWMLIKAGFSRQILPTEPLAKLTRTNCCAAPFALGERFFSRGRSPWLSG